MLLSAFLLLSPLLGCKPPGGGGEQGESSSKSDATLKALTIDHGTLSPAFSPSEVSYSVTLSNNIATLSVTPTSTQQGVKIEVRNSGGAWSIVASGAASQAMPVAVGDNTIEIRVTAQDGSTIKTYAILAHKLSATALIASLTVAPGILAPVFDQNTNAYSVVLPNANTAITVTPTALHQSSLIEVNINGGTWQSVVSGATSSNMSLNIGDNPLNIKVTAEDSSVNTYIITVHRKSLDAGLSSLAPSAGSLIPPFNTSTTSYSLMLPSAVSTITITPTGASSLIEVQVNNGGWQTSNAGAASPSLPLNVGDNLVEVKVTAEEGGAQKVYSIVAHRESGDTNLSALAISSGALNPSFSSGTISYTNIVPNAVSSVTITPTAASTLSTIQVQINGGAWESVTSGATSSPLTLNVGDNPIHIKVTAEDSSTNTYTITAHRRSVEANLSLLVATGGSLNPSFNPATTSYTLTLTMPPTTDAMTVTPTSAYSLAVIEVQVNSGGWSAWASGSTYQIYGLGWDNTVEVRVTSEEGGSQKIYSIAVHRPNFNAQLSSLSISSGTLTPPYSTGTINYTDTVLNAVSSVTVTPTVYFPLSTIQMQVNGGSWQSISSGVASPSITVNPGSNIIAIKVTAELTSYTVTYTISLTRRFPGAVDTDFLIGNGANNEVQTIALQTDGKILLGGAFSMVSGQTQRGIARLNVDGSLDLSLHATSMSQVSGVNLIKVQDDGKILVFGGFYPYDGSSYKRIARLNWDGSLNASLSTGTGAAPVYGVGLLGNGQIIIGGWFDNYNGISRKGIARLNSDGSYDSSFPAYSNLTQDISSLALQGDGKIVIGGWFTTDNWVTYSALLRLNSDGGIDTSFIRPDQGPNNYVYAIALQSDGKIIIAGSFTTYNGFSCNRLARINSDGSLDATFNATLSGDFVTTIAIQSDGKILVGGRFTSFNGISRNNIARLNSDGSLDESFLLAGGGTDDSVRSIAVQTDGNIIIGGDFTLVNGLNKKRLIRLWGN